MIQKTSIFSFLCAVSIGMAGFAQSKDPIFHYSVMDAMRNAVYSGDLTVAQLKKKGNFGLGTYNLLDGEMIALDGVFYRIPSNGIVEKAELERKVPFTSLAFFKADKILMLTGSYNLESLRDEIKRQLPTLNIPYAIRIECIFDDVTVGGADKVSENDTTGLAILMKTRPLYKKQKIAGVIVGFYNPAYAGGLDLSPFHFHFISDDRKFGGHLLSGAFSQPIKVSIDAKTGYEVELPIADKRFNELWKENKSAKSVY